MPGVFSRLERRVSKLGRAAKEVIEGGPRVFSSWSGPLWAVAFYAPPTTSSSFMESLFVPTSSTIFISNVIHKQAAPVPSVSFCVSYVKLGDSIFL